MSLYLEQTGSTAPVASVDLIARVGGFLSEIHYQDDATVKRGDLLFVIEPTPYEAKLKQAEAALIAAKTVPPIKSNSCQWLVIIRLASGLVVHSLQVKTRSRQVNKGRCADAMETIAIKIS